MSKRTSSKMVRGRDRYILPKRAIDSEEQRLAQPESTADPPRTFLSAAERVQRPAKVAQQIKDAGLPVSESNVRALDRVLSDESYGRAVERIGFLSQDALAATNPATADAATASYIARVRVRMEELAPGALEDAYTSWAGESFAAIDWLDRAGALSNVALFYLASVLEMDDDASWIHPETGARHGLTPDMVRVTLRLVDQHRAAIDRRLSTDVGAAVRAKLVRFSLRDMTNAELSSGVAEPVYARSPDGSNGKLLGYELGPDTPIPPDVDLTRMGRPHSSGKTRFVALRGVSAAEVETEHRHLSKRIGLLDRQSVLAERTRRLTAHPALAGAGDLSPELATLIEELADLASRVSSSSRDAELLSEHEELLSSIERQIAEVERELDQRRAPAPPARDRPSDSLPPPPHDLVPAQFSRAVDAQHETLRFWAGPRAESVAAQILDMQEVSTTSPPAQFVRDMIAALMSSEPFYVAPDICDLVGQTSVSWPADAPFVVAALPSRSAWVYFARPIVLGNWTHTQHTAHPTVSLVGMLLVRPSPASPKIIVSGYVRDGHAELAPISWVMLGPEDTVADVQTRFDDREHVLDRPGAILQLVGAFLAFIDQKIAVQSRGHVDRATRRRLERAQIAVPDVRVITLRAARHTDHSGEPSREVEWSCRWLVSGFWRQQPCGPRSAQRRTVWVAPFVKGPPDKPLKAQAARVFAVAR